MKLQRVKNLRIDNDLSQEKFGEILHISQRTYSYYETGKHDVPPEVLSAIADYFNTSVDYLLERTKQKDPYPRE